MKVSERNLRRFIQSVIMENTLLGPDTASAALRLANQYTDEADISCSNDEYVSESVGGALHTGAKVVGKTLQYGGGALLVAGLATYMNAKLGYPLDIQLTQQIVDWLNAPASQSDLAGLLAGAMGGVSAFTGTQIDNLTK